MVRTAAYLAFVIVLTAAACSLNAQSTQENSAPAISLTRGETRLINAVNSYRRKYGLEPLCVDPILMRMGRDAAPYFSHVVRGKWCWQRARDAGFGGWATDDIANGYPTPEEAVQGWASSHGHAMQMRGYFKMNGRWRNYRFNRVGVGISGRKYIAIFGRDDSNREVSDRERVEIRK